MKTLGSKNIFFEGYRSVRKYVFAQFVMGKYPQEIIKTIEESGITHQKAKQMVYCYQWQYLKQLKQPKVYIE